MNALEQLDALAAERRIGSVTLCRVGDMWQAGVHSAVTGGYSVLRKPTPSQALAATLELLPICEAYDKQHGLAEPVEDKPEQPTDTAGIFD